VLYHNLPEVLSLLFQVSSASTQNRAEGKLVEAYPERFPPKPLTLVMRGVRKWRNGEAKGATLRATVRAEFNEINCGVMPSRLTGIVPTATGRPASSSNPPPVPAGACVVSERGAAPSALPPVPPMREELREELREERVSSSAVEDLGRRDSDPVSPSRLAIKHCTPKRCPSKVGGGEPAATACHLRGARDLNTNLPASAQERSQTKTPAPAPMRCSCERQTV